MPGRARFSLPWPPPQGGVADSFWVSLKYFNYYRTAVAAVFLLGVAFGFSLFLQQFPSGIRIRRATPTALLDRRAVGEAP